MQSLSELKTEFFNFDRVTKGKDPAGRYRIIRQVQDNRT